MTDDPTDGWDPARYDDGHAFVYEYGGDVLELLDPAPGERILDLGCGTGHLTAEIAERGSAVLGVDRSRTMVTKARAAYPDRRFVRADARAFAVTEPFDAVFSNAALHWIPEADQDDALGTVADALRPEGRFVAELGGAGNVAAVVDAVRAEMGSRGYDVENPWYFPSVGEYATRLEEHGFEVRFAQLFDRPTELDGGAGGLASWLSMFGDDLLGPVDGEEREAVIRAVEDRLRETLFENGSWVADYRRLRVLAVAAPDVR
jgi:trans-aconitate methyltransferase